MALLISVGVLAPVISPFDPNQQDLLAALQAPDYFAGKFFLGTDHVGRDILSRIIYGARISLVIASTVVLVSGIVGVGFGAISGYFGGRTDFAIQKAVEVVWAFPPLLLAIAILAFLGQGLGILIIALVAQRWIPYCRVARGQTLSLRARDFVTAARSLGASHGRIVGRHILPNLLQAAIVIGTFAMASAIISEASLSFLGLGVPPEIPDLGQHARRRARTYLDVLVARAVSRALHLHDGARHQPAGRRVARHSRPASQAGIVRSDLKRPGKGNGMPISHPKFIDVEGIRTRYFERGSGETVVLVHGGAFGSTTGACSADDWDLNFDGLAQWFRVFAIDKLGQGYTDNPRTD